VPPGGLAPGFKATSAPTAQRPKSQAIELQHGDASFERAADPLHRARIDTEAFRNDAHTWPPDACF